ncbi:MAG: hypothetical protein M3Z66_12365 [Chloroflexota bacterium]|nr:hypothetical protein [Chloroflexota bacterium]
MSLTPAYKLTLGKKVIDTTDKPQASTVVNLTVRLDLAAPADSTVLILGNVGSFKPAEGDDATVELGYADDGGLTQVMKGSVVSVEPSLPTTRVVIYSGVSSLLRASLEQTYESKTAGAMVSDLAGAAGVDVATAEDGITFPAYVVDGRRNLYQHMHDLAELCGFDLYLNPDGAIVFKRFAGGETVHVLEYAKQILHLDIVRAPSLAASVEVWGESPTGKEGDDAWAWLTSDFSGSKGTAGSGTPLFLLERPALRTKDAAQSAATAAFTAIGSRAVRGRLETTGLPAVLLGDAVRLSGLPDSSLNTSFQVRDITHHISKARGFTSTIGFNTIASGSPPGGSQT